MSELIQIKVHRNSRYTIIGLRVVEDPRLSWKAKGLHLYLYSRPQGWKLHYAELLKRSDDGKTSLQSAIEELKRYKYLKINQKRRNGRFAHSIWEVYEEPRVISPYPDFPYTEKPDTENPHPENQTHNNKHINKEHITKKTTTKQTVVVKNLEKVQEITKRTPFEKIKDKELVWMMKKYDIDGDRLCHILDVLSFQYKKGWRVKDPKRTLIAALRDGISEPVDFVPFEIRNKTHNMENRERKTNIKEETEYFKRAMKVFEELDPEEKEIWLKKAEDEVSGFTRINDAVKSVAVHLWSKNQEVLL